MQVFEEFPRELVVAELQSRFEIALPAQKLPVACALAHFGDVRVDYLFRDIFTDDVDEVTKVVAALQHSPQAALACLRRLAKMSDGAAARLNLPLGDDFVFGQKARLAVVALQLEDLSLAQEMCDGSQPIQREIFIGEIARLHGDLLRFNTFAKSISDSQLRSAICLAIGGLEKMNVTPQEKQLWRELWTEWYQNQPDTGTHSACDWALRSWGFELTGLLTASAATAPASDSQKRWRTNSVGTTMLRLDPGSVGDTQTGETVTVARPFWIADREVSVEQFQKFVKDDKYAAAEKPQGWPGADSETSPTPECPVQQVNWYDAVLFCNWLSSREGLPRAYERTGGKETFKDKEYDAWRQIPLSNGYRLPTEAEWEYACRAGSATKFAHGNDVSLLGRYAVFDSKQTEVCGSKLPNRWGLFDCYGNVREWCDLDLDTGRPSVLGGGFKDPAMDLEYGRTFIDALALGERASDFGFRVARTYP
jgi:formylglycine-generating enzyme required for sulfatase activity